MQEKKRVAIVVGGGPAPGINSVIAAATIEACNRGYEVIGIQNGFQALVAEDAGSARVLQIDDVSRIHTRGGSVLGTSRENPTRSNEKLQAVVRTLQSLQVSNLITIGGDDTAYASMCVAQAAAGTIRAVHVPKTIDNDLPLPPGIVTFGYETARDAGVQVAKTLMEDARTTGRWYFIVAMGRKAGHLALGIGNAAGTTLTIIGEEFAGREVDLETLCDVLEGSILKRLAQGHNHGVAILAEGLAGILSEKSLEDRDDLERDEFGHIRFAEVDLGKLLKDEVRRRLAGRGIKMTIVEKNVGYELRCCDPIPFDIEYTRLLGYGAVDLLHQGVSEAMVAVKDQRVVAMRYEDLKDATTGKTKVRLVDTQTEHFHVSQQYMIRLRKEDLADQVLVEKIKGIAAIEDVELRRIVQD